MSIQQAATSVQQAEALALMMLIIILQIGASPSSASAESNYWQQGLGRTCESPGRTRSQRKWPIGLLFGQSLGH